MENIILGYLGKHNASPIFLNMGKYGYYLNYDDKLYSVPVCFQNNKFNLEGAIKIIEYKSKLIKEEKKLKTNIEKLQAATTKEELDDIVKDIKDKKPLKKSNE
jgi:topoisomerase IA-like protein